MLVVIISLLIAPHIVDTGVLFVVVDDLRVTERKETSKLEEELTEDEIGQNSLLYSLV